MRTLMAPCPDAVCVVSAPSPGMSPRCSSSHRSLQSLMAKGVFESLRRRRMSFRHIGRSSAQVVFASQRFPILPHRSVTAVTAFVAALTALCPMLPVDLCTRNDRAVLTYDVFSDASRAPDSPPRGFARLFSPCTMFPAASQLMALQRLGSCWRARRSIGCVLDQT